MTSRNRKRREPPLDPLVPPPGEEPGRARARRYLVILVIGVSLIALLVFGLSKSHPPANAPEALSQGEKSPDALIEKFHLVSTVQGEKTWEFDADVARLYQDQKQAYSDNIFAQYYRKNRRVSTLTADKAIVNTESNATQADGHVELIVENGSKLETDHLSWDPETDLLQTDSRVHIYKGKDEITAVGLVADTELNNVKFTRDVHTEVRDTGEIQDFSKPKPF